MVVGLTGAEDGLGNFVSTLYRDNPAETVMAMSWDPLTGITRGYPVQPAYADPVATEGHPAVAATPAAYDGKVFVGTMQRVDAATNSRSGKIGCLAPRRTLICDANRLVETVGARRTWSLTGSEAYVFGYDSPEEQLVTPFSRPAKAQVLDDESILVVDTGNNRVITVSRAGEQLWPLDEEGFDYYSSPARTVGASVFGNDNLGLDQPTDAYVYVDGTGARHTVIADSGHNRVVDVVTTYDPVTGAQSHEVLGVTQESVSLPGEAGEETTIRYTTAQPLFDFTTGDLQGYLCVAGNLDRAVIVAAGSKELNPRGGYWDGWSWIYELEFSNLRQFDYARFGDLLYVTATAGGLGGATENGVWVWTVEVASGTVTPLLDYTTADYIAEGAFSQIVTTAGATYRKRFYPVRGQVTFPGLVHGGRLVITNYAQMVEQISRPAVEPGTQLFGEVFEVDASGVLLEERSIPSPWLPVWNDPLSQPVYADRY
jgi:hypothetical protein